MAFTYSWKGSTGFLNWLLPNLLHIEPKGALENLREITDGFTKVELTILVNGVEVDAESFLKGVESNMEHYAKIEARQILDGYDIEGEFLRVEEMVIDLLKHARAGVEAKLAEAGFDLSDYK